MTKKTQCRALLGALAAVCLTVNAETNTPASTNTTAAPVDKKDAPAMDDPVVAKGKGFQIKRSQLEDVIISVKANAAAQGQPISDDQRPLMEYELVHELVFKEILLTKATAEDKAKAKTDTDKYLEGLRKRFPSEEAFQTRVKALGLTLEQFVTRQNEQAICNAVLDREVKSKITISDDDLKKYYDENPTEFWHAEKVRASHVLVSTMDKESGEPLSEDKKKEKEKLAKDIKARAEKGEDFAKLAKEFSDDPGSKDKGGEYTFGRGEMVKEFEAAAFSLKTNQVSDIVETRYGYHIIKLNEKIAEGKDPIAEVTPQLREFLVGREIRKRVPSYREQAEKDAQVEIIGIKEPPKETLPTNDAAPAKTNAPAGTNAPATK
jgi:parvulin-like peptidyl-prolyl isomerase